MNDTEWSNQMSASVREKPNSGNDDKERTEVEWYELFILDEEGGEAQCGGINIVCQ